MADYNSIYTGTEIDSAVGQVKELVKKSGDTMTGNLEAPSISIGGDYLSVHGFKNKIINGAKNVNQRGYADGVLADGVYGYDRWKGNSSDVNIEQVIEQENIRTGTYAISWVGGGTATVNGTAGLSSGDSVVVTVTGNVSIIVPKGATDIQLEEGSVATPFEQRPVGLELSLCKRYYEIGHFFRSGVMKNTTSGLDTAEFAVEKRVIPTVTYTISSTLNFTSAVVASQSVWALNHHPTGGTTDSQGRYYMDWEADAEL